MSKYIGPKCKQSRREQMDLETKSNLVPLHKKCNMSSIPGQHGGKYARTSLYGSQLREKQKVKRMYGLRENQMQNYYNIANSLSGNKGQNLLCLVETRLDNVVYRAGFAVTRSQARQIVAHKGVMVNNTVCNIASCLLKTGDKVSLVPKKQQQQAILFAIAKAQSGKLAPWLEVDYDAKTILIIDHPERGLISRDINEQLIIEFYSGK